MKVSGEAGMRQGTVESWSERAREITLGWKPECVEPRKCVEYGRDGKLLVCTS